MSDRADKPRANGPKLRVLSLFSGIGGLDLGLERAGMEVVAHSEIDPYACKVLAKHWPDVPNLGDVTAIDEWPDADVIAGGFPCQDVSLAGKREGMKEGTRSGLWSEYARAIRSVRPRYVIVENVPGLLAGWLGVVLGDLATLGFDAWWDCVPAAAVGAPHRRDRVLVVATRADVAPFDTDCSPMQWASQFGSEPHGDTASVGSDGDRGRQQERAQQYGGSAQATPDRHSRRGHADRLRDVAADTDGAGRVEYRGGGRSSRGTVCPSTPS